MWVGGGASLEGCCGVEEWRLNRNGSGNGGIQR